MDWFCLVKCMLDCSQRLMWFINLDFCSDLGGFGCLGTLLREARFPSEVKSSQTCVRKEVVGLSWGQGPFHSDLAPLPTQLPAGPERLLW